MRRKRSLTTLVLAAVLLAGCGGGGGGDDEPATVGFGDPSGDAGGAGEEAAEESPSAEPSPTTADYEEAHVMYHDLATVLDGAARAAADFQDGVKKAEEADPRGFRKDPAAAIQSLVAAQEAQVATRDAAVQELADHPAMADPELGAAYDAFAEKYAVAMAYQDGFNDSYATFLATNDRCSAVLTKTRDVRGLTVEIYAENWLYVHKRAAAPCLDGAAELATSANEDLARIGTNYTDWIERRVATMRLVRDGKATTKKAGKRLKKVNDAMLKTYERAAKFSDTLGALMPNAEYDAVDVVFKDRVGELGEGDPSATPPVAPDESPAGSPAESPSASTSGE